MFIVPSYPRFYAILKISNISPPLIPPKKELLSFKLHIILSSADRILHCPCLFNLGCESFLCPSHPHCICYLHSSHPVAFSLLELLSQYTNAKGKKQQQNMAVPVSKEPTFYLMAPKHNSSDLAIQICQGEDVKCFV